MNNLGLSISPFSDDPIPAYEENAERLVGQNLE